MKLKKLGLLLAATLLSATLLAGCSGNADSTTDSADSISVAAVEDTATAKTVDELFDLVSAANPISNPRELDDMSITLDFMLSAEDVVSYKGVASNDGGDAGMVIVIEAAEGTADAIYAAMQTYAENQTVFWANYEEFADAEASVSNSLLVQEGNMIIQVFASNEADYADIAAALEEAF